MPTNASELRDFHDFLSEKLSNGRANLSPEQAVDEWRRLHPESTTEDIKAIQEALNDLAGGETAMEFEKFDREFRKRHKLPAKP